MGANENFRKWVSWNEFLAMLRTGEVPDSDFDLLFYIDSNIYIGSDLLFFLE